MEGAVHDTEASRNSRGSVNMRIVTVHGKVGTDGVLHLDIPTGDPNVEFEVLVVMQPTAIPAPTTTPEERGWPPRFFEQTAGKWQGELERAPQGEYEKRDEL
jgi:hypothetical protein